MVVSRTLQQHYRSRHRIEPVYVPNGTVLRKRRPASQLLNWGLEPGGYILFMGRFSPEKNCHLLIEAYKKIETPVKLVLAGGSSHSDAYARALQEHRSDQIRLLDWVSEDALEELLTNALLFVLPSDLEGLSLALLDAMGAGICVLTSDIPENREVVDDAGFTFRPGDVRDLERMLRLLLTDPQVREAAGRRGQEKVWRGWPQITAEIQRTYLRLTGRKHITEVVPTPEGCTNSEPKQRDRAA